MEADQDSNEQFTSEDEEDAEVAEEEDEGQESDEVSNNDNDARNDNSKDEVESIASPSPSQGDDASSNAYGKTIMSPEDITMDSVHSERPDDIADERVEDDEEQHDSISSASNENPPSMDTQDSFAGTVPKNDNDDDDQEDEQESKENDASTLMETDTPMSPKSDGNASERCEPDSEDEASTPKQDAAAAGVLNMSKVTSTPQGKAADKAADRMRNVDDQPELDFEEELAEDRKEEEASEEAEKEKDENAENDKENEEGHIQDDDEDDDGELDDDDDLEEGEVKDEKTTRKPQPRPVCRFFNKGQCTWGSSCRFIHPGINDKGNYSMFGPSKPLVPSNGPGMGLPGLLSAPRGHPVYVRPPPEVHPPPPPPPPVDETPPVESAWERGLRHAKEILKKASKRKEMEPDFEDKRFNLTLGATDSLEYEKENDYYSRSPHRKVNDPIHIYGYDDPDPFERQAQEFWRGGNYENFEVRHVRTDYDARLKEKEKPKERSRRDKYERVQVQDHDWRDHRFAEVQGSVRARGDEWKDPWRRSTSPKRRNRSKSYSSASSASSYSSGSSRSRSSSYSSYSRSSSASTFSSGSSPSYSRSRTRPKLVPHKTKAPVSEPTKSTAQRKKRPVQSAAPSSHGQQSSSSNKSTRPSTEKRQPALQSTAPQTMPLPPAVDAKKKRTPVDKQMVPPPPPPANRSKRRRPSASRSASSSSRSSYSRSSSHSSSGSGSSSSGSGSDKDGKTNGVHRKGKHLNKSGKVRQKGASGKRPSEHGKSHGKKDQQPQHAPASVGVDFKSGLNVGTRTSKDPLKQSGQKPQIKLTLLNKRPPEKMGQTIATRKETSTFGKTKLGVGKDGKPSSGKLLPPVITLLTSSKPSKHGLEKLETKSTNAISTATKGTTSNSDQKMPKALPATSSGRKKSDPSPTFGAKASTTAVTSGGGGNKSTQPPPASTSTGTAAAGAKSTSTSGAAAAKKNTVSRREELLKQLKAVEDAIARKRAKLA